MTTKQTERMNKRKAIKLATEIKSTASYAIQLIKAGWAKEDAIINSTNLFHLSNENMNAVRGVV